MTATTDTATTPFEGHVILEILGHRRLGGYLSQQEIAGVAFVRIDIPSADEDGIVATQFYSPQAVYAITPTTEEIAKAVAKSNQPSPVQRWELPAPKATDTKTDYYEGEDYDLDDMPL